MEKDYPGCRVLIREAYRRRSISESGINILLASLSQSSLKQYNTSLKLWWNFIISNNIALEKPSIQDILQFLTVEFEKGSSYSSLNSHRSALKLLYNKFEDEEILSRFFKGIFRLKPTFPKYDVTWDPSIVLNYLSTMFPLDVLSLQKLTFKLATLLALVSAQRMQTLSKIQTSDIKRVQNHIEIRISDLIKTSRPNKSQPLITLPFFVQKPELCVASTILSYIMRTKDIRQNTPYLFITYKKPHHKASVQTISRWVKTTLKDSGIDTSQFTGHSTRHASTSAAYRAGANVEAIRKAAGWSSKSDVFAKFYNKPLLTEEYFAETILNLA